MCLNQWHNIQNNIIIVSIVIDPFSLLSSRNVIGVQRCEIHQKRSHSTFNIHTETEKKYTCYISLFSIKTRCLMFDALERL